MYYCFHIQNTMLYRMFINFINSRTRAHKIILGRWGYHFEVNKNHQKYYE